MHLFIHLMRLFYEKKKEERPNAIVIENVPEFQKIAGNSLKLALEEEGYKVSMQVLDSAEFGARTKRKRLYFVANIFECFEFPLPTGAKTTPIDYDNVITLESLDWVTPEQNNELKYYINREKNGISHNHYIRSFDITKDSCVGTIPKSQTNYLPENIIRHPFKENTYAFLMNISHLKYLHGIWDNFYLGDTKSNQIQSIGQGICVQVVQPIMNKLYELLKRADFKNEKPKNQLYYEQLDMFELIL